MSLTAVYSGSLSLALSVVNQLSGDQSGVLTCPFIIQSIAFNPPAGAEPVVTGYCRGAAVACVTGTWKLASATNPFGSMSTGTVYSTGFAPGTTSKVKALAIQNTDTAHSINVTFGAADPSTVLGSAGYITIPPGGFVFLYDPAGSNSGAMTADTNDHLDITISGGSSVVALVAIVYGT